MSDVDKLDCMFLIYRTFIRSWKFTLRLFTYAIDLVVPTRNLSKDKKRRKKS